MVLECSIHPPPLEKTGLQDDNILAKLDLPMQPQLTLIKHHYCLLKYAKVHVFCYFPMLKTGNFKLSIRLTWKCSVNIHVLWFYYFSPTYLRVIMSFQCIIDFILHHDLCTTLRDTVFNNLSKGFIYKLYFYYYYSYGYLTVYNATSFYKLQLPHR